MKQDEKTTKTEKSTRGMCMEHVHNISPKEQTENVWMEYLWQGVIHTNILHNVYVFHLIQVRIIKRNIHSHTRAAAWALLNIMHTHKCLTHTKQKHEKRHIISFFHLYLIIARRGTFESHHINGLKAISYTRRMFNINDRASLI